MATSKFEHATRNKSLSVDLLAGETYYDWVITTSFYSAIHFVEKKILPETVNGQYCTNINDVKKAYRIKGRHAARERLVSDFLDLRPAIFYKWLDDKSRYARYTTFKVTKNEADKAQQYLKTIEDACIS